MMEGSDRMEERESISAGERLLLVKHEGCENRRRLLAERMRTLRPRIRGGTRAGAGQLLERGMPKRYSPVLKRKGVERHCNFRTKSTTCLNIRR